jgi:hypothetical protein
MLSGSLVGSRYKSINATVGRPLAVRICNFRAPGVNMSTSRCAVQIRILHSRLAGAATTSYGWRSVGGATRPLRSRTPRQWSPLSAHTVVASAIHDGNAPSRPPTEGALRLLATSERGTEAAAAMFAADLRAGDCYCLVGEVGAGKSAFRYVRADFSR